MEDLYQIINNSMLINSKQQILENVKQNQIYLPTNLESKLQKWNSKPIINFETNKLELSFGVLFCQMIKLSQQQSVRDNYSQFYNNNQKFTCINPNEYIQLCRQVFSIESLKINTKNDAKMLDRLFQERIVLEKYLIGEQPYICQSRQYISLKNQNEENLKYRILLYQSPHEYGSKLHIIFSTNNDIDIITNQNFSRNTSFISKPSQPFFTIQQKFTQTLTHSINSTNQISHQQLLQKRNCSSSINFFTPQQQQYKYQLQSQEQPTYIYQPQQQQQQQQEQLQQLQINKKYQNNEGITQNINNYQQTSKIMDIVNENQKNQSNIKKFYQSNICQKKIESKKCDICQIEYDLNSDQSIKTPCCNVKVHSQCLQTYLEEKAKEMMNFENITCLSCQKQLKDQQDFLKQIIS